MNESSRDSADGLKRYLATLDRRMRTEIARTPAAGPALTLLDAGGKRLRAQLLWWSANATASSPLDPECEQVVRAATAIEFAHLGSLIHDDIVDAGNTRRGIATLHNQFGIRAATETGVALAHLANELIASLGHSVRRTVRRAILATCRGQLRELTAPFGLLTPRARLAIMHEKTAAFFELAAAIGAQVGNASRSHRASVCRFARRFGIAFQIADDVLDLAGDPAELGRENGSDLRDGVMTLPVLLAADPDHALSRALNRVRTSPDATALAQCAALIERGGGIATARAAASWWLERAVHALVTLPPTRALIELVMLARASVSRGLRAGRVSFTGSLPGSSFEPNEERAEISPFTQSFSEGLLEPRLRTLLNWFRPGLAASAAAELQDRSIHAQCERLRSLLLRADAWSTDARTAANAIAFAAAIARDRRLEMDPGRTLALIDALHCAAIGLLNREASSREHATLAARVRKLHSTEAQPAIGFSPATYRYQPPMTLPSS